jgi:hypothetical protein
VGKGTKIKFLSLKISLEFTIANERSVSKDLNGEKYKKL